MEIEEKTEFKGIWISKDDILKLGWKKAFIKSAYLNHAPNMIKNEIKEAIKLLDINKDPQSIKKYVLENVGNLYCEWCDRLVHSLQEHHFPISKKDGGKNIVKICGACHSDYHSIKGAK
jgi:hypothetical protein